MMNAQENIKNNEINQADALSDLQVADEQPDRATRGSTPSGTLPPRPEFVLRKAEDSSGRSRGER
jgi:hypothetical protein